MYEIFDRLLKSRGLKIADVSRGTGISGATLYEWKAGKYTPKADKLQMIADFFGVSVDYLMTGDQETEAGYYTDPETAKVAQEILDDPHLRALFSAARDSRPEDLETAAALLRRFKETNPDG